MVVHELQLQVDDRELPDQLAGWLDLAQRYVSRYWDKSPSRPPARYAECDFQYVAVALNECVTGDLIDGQKFVEWGCGFGVITGVASLLGLNAVGIEAEEFLVEQATKLLELGRVDSSVWHGNYLPSGARILAEEDDPIVSLGCQLDPVYETHHTTLREFALIFAYAWPGEEHFLKLVFDRHARSGALLLLYRGPYHIELYRKH